MKMLEQVLGKKTADRLTEGTYIARGHLAPDADFIFGSWQFLTYFYANVAPQWQSINAGNWLATEKNVRKKAIELNRDLTVYTGTQGILTIEGKQLYLEPKKKQVPIPENFWKLLFDEKTKQGIAIIGSNNPILENEKNLLCQDICKANGWADNLRESRKGLIYCCTVADLLKAVPAAPDIKVTGGILQGPKQARTGRSKAWLGKGSKRPRGVARVA